MKFLKRLLLFCLIIATGAVVINTKTDFFYNITTYIPAMEDYPLVTKMISDASFAVSEVTAAIPTPSEIIALIKNEEMPIDPEDVAHNAYISDSPMLSFYPHENISIMVDETGEYVNVFGIIQSIEKSHLVVNFSDAENEQLDQTSIGADTSMQFNRKIKIPDTLYNELSVTVFTGAKEYGQYTSWVLDMVHLVRNEYGTWNISTSPVYEHNKMMYEKDKSVSEALKKTPSIRSEDAAVISIAQQLTESLTNDYDKAVALHDWVCSYLYYDEDGLASDTTIPYQATEVIKNQKAVCLGFATLYAALCRSLDIPCNVVSGYALGIGNDKEWSDSNIYTDYQNHAWNEVYVDGRWVIVDVTWDCRNKIRGGERIKDDSVSHLYFDSNLQYFSQNHKILEYDKRR